MPDKKDTNELPARLPGIDGAQKLNKHSSGRRSIYSAIDDKPIIVVLDGTVTLSELVNTYLQFPKHLSVHKRDGWIMFQKSEYEEDFKRQGESDGDHARFVMISIMRDHGMTVDGFKAFYKVTLHDGLMYLRADATPFEVQIHTPRRRSK